MIKKKLKINGGNNMFQKFYTTILLILFACAIGFAQDGRISGKITDKQTGEPLIGANIIVVGTSLGAASDINGDYLITPVPAGLYSVKASYIGYQDVTVSDLRVVSGLTSQVNFEAESEEISTSEVIIISQRPLIEKSSTNAVRIIGADDLNTLPVRDIGSIVALQPGVVVQNGLTFIRGSRPDETGYMVEGSDVKDVLNRRGGSLIQLTPDALQEVLVQAGGYTAEFGNANAGIVSSEFKTGTNEYHFSVRAETDNFGNYPGDKFLGTYSQGYTDLVLTLSGPIISDKVKVFLSGENSFIRDNSPKFVSDNPTRYSDGALWDTTKVYDTGFYGGSTSEYQILNWRAGNIPGVMDNRYTANGTVLFDNNPLILRLAGAFTFQRLRGASTQIVTNGTNTTLIDMFNTQRLAVNDNSSLLLNLKGTYLLSSNSFIEANVGYYDYRHKIYDPYFEDDILSYSDSLAALQYGWEYPSYATTPVQYDFYGFPFSRPGALSVAAANQQNEYTVNFTKDHNTYFSGSASYTGQIQKHAIKIGGSFQRWTVRGYRQTNASTLLSSLRNNPDRANNKDSLNALIGNVVYQSFNSWGFDNFGVETDDEPFAPKHPVFASGYVEDRIEVSDMIINAGFRWDYIDMDSWNWVNPRLPAVNNWDHTIPDSALQTNSTYSYVSPRLGFSFPVTDRTVFHLQYGKFVQSPSLDVAYRGVYQAVTQQFGGNLYSNLVIAYDPKPIRTTQYEIGFSQQFTDFAAFDITAFYKDIKGQLQYAVINTEPGAPRSKYNAMTNQDFATTKGLEVSFKLRRTSRIRAEVNYTFATAEGTNSFSGSGVGSQEVNGEVPTVLLPLDYNQTHKGTIFLDYRFDKDDGGPILEQLGVNLLVTFNSGHPFTYGRFQGLGQAQAWTGGLIPLGISDTRGRRPIGAVNSSTTPWVYNLDLRVDKTVDIYNFEVNFYVYVSNLLNTKNVLNVYDYTGNAYSDGFLNSSEGQQIIANERYTERFADLYRALNYENRHAALAVYGFDLFGPPRQLRAGITVNF